MDILSGLNPEQLRAVKHVDGPLLVVAGAGTGKTQVITRRIAYLIAEGHAKPQDVLALTFTEKAAREMADRLYGLIGWESFQANVMTFNAFGSDLLGRYAMHIGRSVRGGLLNTTQKTLLLQQHFNRITLEYYAAPSNLYEFVERMVRYIEGLQNAGITAERYGEFVNRLQENEDWQAADIAEQRDLAAVYKLYETLKQENGTFDYSDQLVVPLEILRQRPNLADRLRRQYKFVLVDEYQDTSPIQDALLREIIRPGGNIFAVGDDDQAIYGFRGADIQNILDFADHFGVGQAEALVQNYRSGQPILDVSYQLIRHNSPDRLEDRLGINKRLIAQHEDAKVEYRPYRKATDEQAAVVEDIAGRIASGEKPSTMAVLARSNALLRTMAKALRLRQIPFAISTEVNIFEQRELIHLWYLLEWLQGRAQEDSVVHVLLGPFVQWRASECRRLVEEAHADMVGLDVVLARAEDGARQELWAQVEEWRNWAAELPVSQLAYRLVFETGVADRLVQQGAESARVVRVFDDLHVLLSQMQDYETVAVDSSLAGYLRLFPEPPVIEASEALGDPEGIQLLTVHASKGLEFDTVFVVNCTAKAWSERAVSGLQVPAELQRTDELPAVHEQRRLMYVAATRAKRELFLSSAWETAGGQRQAISPLVAELLGETGITKAPEEASQKHNPVTKLQQFYPLQEELGEGLLPFESESGWIELAVGALGQYKRCPHEFYLQHVLKIAQPFGPQLAFGTALHGAVQAYYEAILRGEKPDYEQLVLRLDELWSDRGYETRQIAELARERARSSLAQFMEREQTEKDRTVLGSELKIVLELPEYKLRLRGRIDAYYETPEGVEIRDFKTGEKRDAEKLTVEAKDNFQLRTYALAYQEMTGQAPAAVTLDYLVTGVTGTARLTPRILLNHREKLGQLAEKIRQREFAPAPLSEFHQCAAFMYYGEETMEEAV